MAAGLQSHFQVFYQGEPAAAATCTVYQSGTTTPVTIYSDAGLSTPASNPITADDYGLFNFYVGTSVNLRYYIETAGGALIRDADPVYPVPILTGLTSSVAELNILDGVTASAAEINILDGVTASTAELNILDGVTATAAEINILDADVTTGAFNGNKGSDIVSAASIDLGVATGNFIDITGTTTITALGTVKAGVIRYVRFTGALTLTHNATSLILPTGANITTVANDRASFISLGSGNWLCFSYIRADGTALSGAPFSDASALIKNASDATKLFRFNASGITTGQTRNFTVPDCDLPGHYVQHVYTSSIAYANVSAVIPQDDTIPQNTEGAQILSVSITPKNANNILIIEARTSGAPSTGVTVATIALFQDSTANALVANQWGGGDAGSERSSMATLVHRMVAGSTSATTFSIRCGVDSGNLYVNGVSGGRRFGGVQQATLKITEYSA